MRSLLTKPSLSLTTRRAVPLSVSFASHASFQSGATSSGIAWRKICAPRDSNVVGAPLLMINGFACSASEWGALPKLLSTSRSDGDAKVGRDVITFDHRGIGESLSECSSEDWAEKYSIIKVAQDAIEVAKDATDGHTPVHLLGISLGGMVAQQIALDSRLTLRSLTLGCTTHGGKSATPPPKSFLKIAAGWKDTNFHDDAAQRAIAEEFISYCLPKDYRQRPGETKCLRRCSMRLPKHNVLLWE